MDVKRNPLRGEPSAGELAFTWGWASYNGKVDGLFRIVCAEFKDDCGHEKRVRTWYPRSGFSLPGIKGNFAIEYNPLTAVRGVFSLKMTAQGVAYVKAGQEASGRLREKLESQYGTLDAFAKSVCIATAHLKDK